MAAAAWASVRLGLARAAGLIGLGVGEGIREGLRDETRDLLRQAIQRVQEVLATNAQTNANAAPGPIPDPALEAIMVELQGLNQLLRQGQATQVQTDFKDAALIAVAIAGGTVAGVAIYRWLF